nr:uncharacterized protein LOC109773856 [Aegilops tauschii subsp. strangulata]
MGESESEEPAEDGGEGEGEESTEDGGEWEAEPGLQPAAKNPPQSNKLPARKRGKTPARAPVHQNGEKKKPQHIGSAEPKQRKSRRIWSPNDEVLILEELAEHRRQHGKVPAWGTTPSLNLLPSALRTAAAITLLSRRKFAPCCVARNHTSCLSRTMISALTVSLKMFGETCK